MFFNSLNYISLIIDQEILLLDLLIALALPARTAFYTDTSFMDQVKGIGYHVLPKIYCHFFPVNAINIRNIFFYLLLSYSGDVGG